MNFVKLSSVFRYYEAPLKSTEIKILRNLTVPGGSPGAGAGKGGGAGGSVREAGGGLGKYGAAKEEGYFHAKQRKLLEKIKKRMQLEKENLPQKRDE